MGNGAPAAAGSAVCPRRLFSGRIGGSKVFAHGKPAILLARRIGKKGVLKGIASLTVPCNPFIRSADSGRSSLRRCRRFLCPLKSAARDAFMGHTQAAGQGREGGSPIASLDHACRTLSAIRKRAIVHWNPKSRDEAQTISTADLPEPFPFGPCLNLYRSLIGRTKDGYVTGWDTGAGASSFLRSHAGIGFSSGLEQWTTFISTSNSTAKTSFRLVLFSFYALLEQSVPLPCAAPVGRYKRARRHVPPSSL